MRGRDIDSPSVLVLLQPALGGHRGALLESMRKQQLWSSVAQVTLVELQEPPADGPADVFVLFRLGAQNYRSKVIV